MAPHRLKARLDLRIEAAGVTPPTFRFWLISRTPTVLIDYLLEVLIATVALLFGVAFLTGYVDSPVAKAMPNLVTICFGCVLLAGFCVVGTGLKMHRYGTVLPVGLSLLAGAYACYTVAIWYYAGPRTGLTTLIMAAVLAALSLWRGFLLRSTFLLFTTRGRRAGRED